MKKGTDDHPKTHDLCERLNIEVPHAIGILELLWAFAREYTPAGDVGKYPDSALARACHWRKKPADLIDALIEARWLDRSDKFRILIHDWPDHCDDYTRKKLKRGSKMFAFEADTVRTIEGSLSGQMTAECPDKIRQVSGKFQPRARAEPNQSPTRAQPEPEPESATDSVRTTTNGDGFMEFRQIAEDAGMSGSEPDWEKAQRFEWRGLDFEQRLSAVQGIRDRKGTGDPALDSLPQNYLADRKWQRKIRSPLRLATRNTESLEDRLSRL